MRRVRPDGTITTVAGTGVEGFSGDGGPATAAQLNRPIGVDPTADGGFLIADSFNNRVRRVAPDGTITTVAGTGVRGFSGDGGPATAAEMGRVWSVAVTAGGAFLVAEPENNRVRRVRPDGTITTVAGTGIGGFSGDGGPATAAQLNGPLGVAPTLDGGFLVADDRNNRVRYVEPPGASRRRLLYAAFLRARLSARLGRRFSLRYVSTAAARVRVCVERGPCARERIRGGRGAVTLALRRRGRFTVVLTAWGRGGRLVTDRLRLTVR